MSRFFTIYCSDAGRWMVLFGLFGLILQTGCVFDRTDRVRTEPTGVQARQDRLAERAALAPEPKISAGTHMAAGRMLERQGDLMSAVDQYERAIASNPRLIAAYNRLGIVYQQLGRFEDSEQMFRAGLRADPGSATMYNNLGYSFLLQHRYAEAEQEFENALSISPEFEKARMNRAIALGYLGKMGECVAEFSRVVSPEIAHYNAAMLKMHRGDYDGARRSLNEALAINPSCPGAAEQLRRAEALAAGGPSAGPSPALQLRGPLAGTPTAETNVEP